MLVGYLVVSVLLGFSAGQEIAGGGWERIMLWAHRQEFGFTDPLFHRDVGFFVFSLPLYRAVASWLLLVTAVALVATFASYVATGAIRLRPAPVSATRAAHTHVLVLGALLLLVVAGQHWLGQFQLEMPDGDKVPGASYTDVHVLLPFLRVRTIIALGAAAMLICAVVLRSWTLPTIAVVMVIAAELVNPAILPAAVQRFVVDPQTLSRERPYITHSVDMTRRAYGLREIPERSLPADGAISPSELEANRDVLENVQLWDVNVLRPQIDQQHSISSYYSFPNVTVDRYSDGGRTQALLVAERELDIERLAPNGRTWANDQLAYTHGHGVVTVKAGELDHVGRPVITPVRLREPRIYYGVQPEDARPWVIVNTKRTEVEKPLSSGTPVRERHYEGPGGIPLKGMVRRGLLALRFGDINLALSQTLKDGSRLVLHRDVRERLGALAPFLRWEREPEVAVVDGRVVFIAHGYTTTDSFPYSEQVRVGRKRINYMRGAVVGTVDAYTGRVDIYATDPTDPLLRAWRSAFPTLFQDAERMPAGIRAHLRYPKELFHVQSEVWSEYHIEDVDDFYTRADAWDRPVELAGPVQKVGQIRLGMRGGEPRMKPYYLLARLPGDAEMRFMLTTIFTPHSQENLSGYLAGSIDSTGRPQLTQMTVPRERPVLGPSQVARQILGTPEIGNMLRLLNQETTDLGDRAVESVELSAPRVVPIGDSFLYVQPIYITAQGSGVTRVRLVTVYLNGRVGWGKTLDQALERALNTPISERSAERSDSSTSTARVR
jgi:uncharacterized membrane protein (UPF0182 family)